MDGYTDFIYFLYHTFLTQWYINNILFTKPNLSLIQVIARPVLAPPACNL